MLSKNHRGGVHRCSGIQIGCMEIEETSLTTTTSAFKCKISFNLHNMPQVSLKNVTRGKCVLSGIAPLAYKEGRQRK
jgi:hypothetical protein